MKTTLSHLPEVNQREILRITDIIREVAAPEKIILFGSYAKGKQVNHKYKGKDGIVYEYISDYDFLVVTKVNNVKDYVLEDIITNKTAQFSPSANIQIHDFLFSSIAFAVG